MDPLDNSNINIDTVKKNINLLDKKTAFKLVKQLLRNDKITYDEFIKLIVESLRKTNKTYSLFS